MITLHIEAENMNELILKASDAIYGKTPQEAEHLYTVLTNPSAPERPTVAPEAPAEEPAAAQEIAKQPEKEAYTLEEVRKALREATESDAGKAEMKAIFKDFGVTKFPEIDAEHYPEIMARIKPFLKGAA